MRRTLVAIGALIAVGAAAAGGFWLGRQPVMPGVGGTAPPAALPPQPAAERPILYYRHPDGDTDYSAEPKTTPDGRPYVAVRDDGPDPSARSDAPPPAAPRKVLYYRNPMGLPDTSPTPKKDWMGMDYIPVYEGEDQDERTVQVSIAKVQRLGVRTEAAELRALARTIRAAGSVQMDESRLAVVTTKFEGYVERLLVASSGQTVRRGQPLAEIYSPDLVAAQQEFLIALQAADDLAGAPPDVRSGAQRLVDGALARLRNLDFGADQIQRLRRDRTVARRVIVRAPGNGVVLDKPAIEGMRIVPGEVLFRTADLSVVWLIAEVFEQDLGLIRQGQPARIMVNAYPARVFEGRVELIYPALSRETRTARVRLVVPNPEGLLRADLYATVELAAAVADAPVLAVPESAVINSGTRQAVLVERGEGRYEPRDVALGAHADGFYEIRSGLAAGERVVVSANFLIDAESNLRAALRAFTAPEGKDGK